MYRAGFEVVVAAAFVRAILGEFVHFGRPHYFQRAIVRAVEAAIVHTFSSCTLAITFLKGTVELEGRNSLGVRDDQQHVVVRQTLERVDVLGKCKCVVVAIP